MNLLHFADVHLGMTNYGWQDVHTGLHTRILDYLDAMDAICSVAEYSKPDIIAFAGDAFRTRTPSPTLTKLFADRIVRLANVAPVLMVLGNHDRQSVEGKHHSIDIMSQLQAKHPIYVSSDVEVMQMGCAVVVTLPWL